MLNNRPPRGVGSDGRPEPEPQATARWASTAEVAAQAQSGALRYAPGAVWLGRTNDERSLACGVRDDRHIVTIAGSRAGKGRSCIMPALCDYAGSIVLVDPKGDGLRRTAGRRGEGVSDGSLRIDGLGQKVCGLDPFGVGDCPSEYEATFNPLDEVRPDDPEVIEQAELLADAVVVPGDTRDVHWDDSGRALIHAVILLVALDPAFENSRNLTTVRRLISGAFDIGKLVNGESDPAPLEAFGDVSHFHKLMFLLMSSNAGTAVGDVMQGVATGMLGMGEAERGSVLSTVNRNLRFLDSPAIQRVTSKTDLCGRPWGLEELKTSDSGMTLYLVLPQRYMATHNRWLRMMLMLIIARMEKLAKQPKYPVLTILDEAHVLGPMKIVAQSAAFMASFGVRLWYIAQDLSQIKSNHKDTWETFLGNCGVLNVFGNTDLSTLELVSKLLGEVEVLTTSETRGSTTIDTTSNLSAGDMLKRGGGVDASLGDLDASFRRSSSSQNATTHATSVQRTPLLHPNEIGRLFAREAMQQIVLIPGHHPMVLRRVNYDTDGLFKGQYDPRPE